VTLLNEADAVYLGGSAASAAYAGAVKVWPTAVVFVTRSAVVAGLDVVGVTVESPRQSMVFGVMVNS
jgi:hypothetical protein